MRELAQTISKFLRRRGKISSKGGQPVPIAPETLAEISDYVSIRVRIANLDPETLIDGQELSGHLYLIEGAFGNITRYAGNTVDWVIKMAHLLCEPLGNGRVYTHTTGTPAIWRNSDRDSSWQEVVQGDLLHPGIYEFESTSPITLSKICDRQTRSVTSRGSVSVSNSTTFRRRLSQRDGGGCAVTTNQASVIASHLIPRRIGSDRAKDIVERFAGATEAADIHQYHPKIGLLLFSGIDHLVDIFQAGFYQNVNNNYTLHNFNFEHPEVSILGTTAQNFQLPPLHGYSATLSVHAGDQSLPLPGVFNWHYLQCVINKFGTEEYKGFHDIYFFVYPFRTALDTPDDESGGDFDTNPPYPSYYVDRSVAQQVERHRTLERHNEVLQWVSGVPSGVPGRISEDRTKNE